MFYFRFLPHFLFCWSSIEFGTCFGGFYLLVTLVFRMTKNLPPNLLALFGPRPPLEYKPPPDRLSIDRKPIKITGIAEYVDLFEVCLLF